MLHTENIEKSILVSVLEAEFVNSDRRIVEMNLNADYFSNGFHKMLVKGINRLKELNDPVNTDMLRYRFISANKWDYKLDDLLMEIMAHNPLQYDNFTRYYSLLEKEYFSEKLAI